MTIRTEMTQWLAIAAFAAVCSSPVALTTGLTGTVRRGPATPALFVGARFMPGANEPGPVLRAAATFVAGPSGTSAPDSVHRIATDIEGNFAVSTRPTSVASATIASTKAALAALTNVVRPLSHPRALKMAVSSYFAFKTAHPGEVKKPFLYFVDYGLPSTAPRGYVFDMST